VSGEQHCRGLAITNGEIHFLWWFIQGSIMTPETRNALLRGYGFCERHAWVHLSVEMAFRRQHFLGPVILYRALIERSVQALRARRRGRLASSLRQLKTTGPCFLCALNIDHAGSGAAPAWRLDRGRDSSGLCTFATSLAPFWRSAVCTSCADRGCDMVVPPRCRSHLLDDLRSRKPVDLAWQEAMLEEVSVRLARSEASFVAGAEEPSDQDRAALVVAAGWCSGWRPLLSLLSEGN
jgi:hypothetical protein